MRSIFDSELAYQVIALLASIILIHATYVGLIRPAAEFELARQAELLASGEVTVVARSIYVVLRDLEQEACIILFAWAISRIALKGSKVRAETAMLEKELLVIPEGTSLLPQDARSFARTLEALPMDQKELLLVLS